MVGHARLACDGAGHWLGGLARVEQVGQRGEVKVAASENRTLSESVRASGEFWLIYSTRVRGGEVSGFYLFISLVSTAAGELRAIQAATRARTSRRRACLVVESLTS